ncbi:hypothetical protein C8Q78DRAFT_825696 [Trametes maxima]|nr:hypothetical protein C8Q78DRAFT_825696 [Trametes maxima]
MSGPPGGHRVYPLETTFGVDAKDVHKGEEEFVLKDEQLYVLLRPALHRPIQFTVPNRISPSVVPNAQVSTFWIRIPSLVETSTTPRPGILFVPAL